MSRDHGQSRRQFLVTTAGAAAGVGAGMLTATAGPALAAPSRPGSGRQTTGISWPAGQALPRFATPVRLDVADMTGVSADEQVLLTTLQGIVNRNRPRIYLLQPSNEGLDVWLDDTAIPYQVASDPMSLLTKYRSEITGAVVYDPNVAATVNVATTMAGLKNAVATSATMASSAGLPVIANLTGMFSSDLDAYTWAMTNLWPHTTHRMFIGLDPGISGFLRDYAVANRGMVMFLDPGTSDELALLEQAFKVMPHGAPYLGWWPSNVSGESDGTQVTSEYGLLVLAADYSANLTVFGGVQAPVSSTQHHAPVPALENKIYVTFSVTDGDNLQYNQHRMRQVWADPDRGQVPINWTVQPLGVDAAPSFLSYYQQTATSNDYLIAGPSGAGYVYPGDWPSAELSVFTQLTAKYMGLAGMDVAVILNRQAGQDVAMDAVTARDYVSGVAPIGLLESWNNYTWMTAIAGTPLCISWLASTVAEGQQAISAASAGWDGSAPLFLSIGIDAWNLAPTDVVTIANSLNADYVVVRGDQFFALAKEMNLVPTGANLLGSAPTGQLNWQGPVENGVGSIPGTLNKGVTTPQGASAVWWAESSAAPNSWIWVDPASELIGGNYYEVSVTVQGTGYVYLDFWNGQNDLTTSPVKLTSTPVTLTLRAWVPQTQATHLQVRTFATGPVGLYASAASIQLLGA
jgi:hypothetical protein